MTFETLDIASLDLAEARLKIETARAGLLKAGDNPDVQAAIQRLGRIEAELKRVEDGCPRGSGSLRPRSDIANRTALSSTQADLEPYVLLRPGL